MQSAAFSATQFDVAAEIAGGASLEDQPPSAAREAILNAAEPLSDVHAIIVSKAGAEGLDLLCGLIRRGCGAATELTVEGRIPAEPVELAIFPSVGSLESAHCAIQIAARSLLPCGRIVLQATSTALVPLITKLLKGAGFSVSHSHPIFGGAVITANWPMFGHHLREVGRA